MDSRQAAQHLLQARASGEALDWRALDVQDAPQAYAVQDATLTGLGAAGGWKVGSRGEGTQASCAPLPATGILASGVALQGGAWRLRGLEVELALRVGRDLGVNETADSREALLAVFDAALPAIEVVETRLGGGPNENPWAAMADLLSHGALVIGQPRPLAEGIPDLRTLTASLALDGQEVARMTGANPVGDVWPVLAWLVRHSAARGMPLRKGQIVTTGSCTGVAYAAPGQQVRAEVTGLGEVGLSFPA